VRGEACHEKKEKVVPLMEIWPRRPVISGGRGTTHSPLIKSWLPCLASVPISCDTRPYMQTLIFSASTLWLRSSQQSHVDKLSRQIALSEQL